LKPVRVLVEFRWELPRINDVDVADDVPRLVCPVSDEYANASGSSYQRRVFLGLSGLGMVDEN
jgi:hypothetical protein